MRLRLLRRRLTISAPRMAVRSALPWPFRWALLALMAGFCGAISLWAFELGKEIAGLDQPATAEVDRLRAESAELRRQLQESQSVANTAGSQLTTERAAQAGLVSQIRELEAANNALRDDLGFFERLLPISGGETISIRGLQAEMREPQTLGWQVLVIQSTKNAPVFNGQMEISLSGVLAGKPWQMKLPEGPMALQLQQYRRLQGTVEVPTAAVVQAVTARLIAGGAIKSQQTVRL